MAEQKITRKNHPLLVKARQEGYQQGYRAGRKKDNERFEAGFEAGRRSLDNYINTLHNHYKYLINNISYVSFDEIKLVYEKESDPHFVDTVGVYWRFNHKDYGPALIPYHNLPLLCERLNIAFKTIIEKAKEGKE